MRNIYSLLKIIKKGISLKQCSICKEIFSKRQKRCPYCYTELILIQSHTKSWYLCNWGINPERLGLTSREVDNPHYRKAPPMKLWAEPVVEEAMQYFEIAKKPNQKKIERLNRRAYQQF